MIQIEKSNTLKWIAVGFLLAASAVIIHRNAEISEALFARDGGANARNDVEDSLAPANATENQGEAEVSDRIDVSNGAGESNDTEFLDLDGQELQADRLESFRSISRALIETVEDLESQFVGEPVDQGWSNYQEQLIQTEFVNHGSLIDYSLSELECRTTICRGVVRTIDDRPIENFGTSIAVALSGFDSIELNKFHIESGEASSAKVFFARKVDN